MVIKGNNSFKPIIVDDEGNAKVVDEFTDLNTPKESNKAETSSTVNKTATTTTPSASTTPAATSSTSSSRGSYVESDLVKQAQAALQAHLNSAPGAYQSQWQAQMDEIMNAYRNREDFQYDLDSDALYQQYADQYALKGQLAMMDTMGQAAAMTGGYGNSYAATAGNQAYQSYLQQLNDVVPELSAMAYDRYQQEGEDMLNEYSLLSDRESSDYAKYQDQLNKYYTDLDYLANRYDSERAFDYGSYQDQIAYDQWREEMDFQKGQYADSLKAASKNTVGDYTGNPSNPETVDDETIGNANVDLSGIRTKLDGMKSNAAAEAYLEQQEASGVIDHETALKLMSEYMDVNEAYDDKGNISYSSMVKSTSGWSVADDGGVNWFWGVDNNARVEAPNGEIIRLDNLVDKLVSEGMEKSDAKSYVKKLQKNLGI